MSREQQARVSLLYQALSCRIGLLLRSSEPERARAALYSARRATGDPALAELQIRVSPFPEGDLIVCNRKIEPRREAV